LVLSGEREFLGAEQMKGFVPSRAFVGPSGERDHSKFRPHLMVAVARGLRSASLKSALIAAVEAPDPRADPFLLDQR
jgi:hypothetical protein